MSLIAYRDDKLIPAPQMATVIYDLSKLRGVNEDRLLKGTGIFVSDLKRVDTKFSPDQILRLLTNYRALMPGHNSAFLLGHRLFPTLNTSLNASLIHCGSLQHAFRVLALVRQQLCPFVHGYFHKHKDKGYFLLNDAIGCGDLYHYILEIYCTAFISACKTLVGKRIPFSFAFPFSRPRHIEEYEKNLGHRLRFDEPILSINFDLRYLETELAMPSRLLQRSAKQLLSKNNDLHYSFVEYVRNLIYFHNFNLTQTAEKLNMSPATLKRRLKQHDTSFQQLQDGVNQQKAIFMLRVKSMKNEAVATQLAFNDVTNFRRAFKRWTGVTPNQLRFS
ncbi:AraC family transcriptional regulator ligand-binding domain-containing protein [Alteromonas sp. 5E99-2]|uniref:AraC family transcriptional regulator ligand-binding domain-containing protein n=1 Tax=Alteromonas sp. 5E99-2 TaxID=2817683 RepID=UPI001A984F9B|nr:AraC family transcriptional regulator ligand-binding domain-containing protein [Alteromonas sp. 5E99-2]